MTSLVEYTRQLDCFICASGNRPDAESCRYCSAPLALAYQTANTPSQPQLVAVIGTPNSGKTVYLGMLTDILSRQPGTLRILARGAYSVSLQQHTVAALSRRQFPPGTPDEPDGWNWAHCEVTGLPKQRRIELVLPDVSGRALLAEVESPHSHPVLRSFLAKSSAAIVLVDSERLEAGEPEQDFVTMKILNYLFELDADRRSGWPRRPVALVFSKADCSETSFDDPVSFAEARTPGLWQLCKERLRRHRFFATSVAGACARVRCRGEELVLPLRIEPRGVTDPLVWLVEQLSNERRRGR